MHPTVSPQAWIFTRTRFQTSHRSRRVRIFFNWRIAMKTSDTACRGPLQRRQFLRFGLAGLGGLTLPQLLRGRAEAQEGRLRQNTALLVVWLHGGASHLETYDPKPMAPSEY